MAYYTKDKHGYYKQVKLPIVNGSISFDKKTTYYTSARNVNAKIYNLRTQLNTTLKEEVPYFICEYTPKIAILYKQALCSMMRYIDYISYENATDETSSGLLERYTSQDLKKFSVGEFL
jgi:hypothetical protein